MAASEGTEIQLWDCNGAETWAYISRDSLSVRHPNTYLHALHVGKVFYLYNHDDYPQRFRMRCEVGDEDITSTFSSYDASTSYVLLYPQTVGVGTVEIKATARKVGDVFTAIGPKQTPQKFRLVCSCSAERYLRPGQVIEAPSILNSPHAARQTTEEERIRSSLMLLNKALDALLKEIE